MIINLNKNYLLYSALKKRGKSDKRLYYEHYLGYDIDRVNWIKDNYKSQIDKRYNNK